MNARNPIRIDAHRIDLEVEIEGVWHPFTAADYDVLDYGQDLYARAIKGEFGEVAEPPAKPQGAAPHVLA